MGFNPVALVLEERRVCGSKVEFESLWQKKWRGGVEEEREKKRDA